MRTLRKYGLLRGFEEGPIPMFPSTCSARRLHSRLLTPLVTFNPVAFQVESLEREMRIELTTSSLACWRSSSELFPRTLVLPRGFEPHSPESKSGIRPLDEGRSGSESWVRTNDPLVNSQVLYRLSYPRRMGKEMEAPSVLQIDTSTFASAPALHGFLQDKRHRDRWLNFPRQVPLCLQGTP